MNSELRRCEQLKNSTARRSFVLALAIVLASLALGQALNAPVENFKLPLFNEQGFRAWYLRGKQGIYTAEKEVKIVGMDLQQYSGNEADQVIALMKSPEANMRLNPLVASGPGEIQIESDLFKAVGEDWIWQGSEKRLIINNNIKVVINAEIGDIIR